MPQGRLFCDILYAMRNCGIFLVGVADKLQTADGVTVPAMDFKLVNDKSAINN